jgi:deazaflavin-dependent oxidoreductase (nitroreductase family)
MSKNQMSEYLGNGSRQKDQLEDLPDEVTRELRKHLALYLTNPAAAHLWDPIIIGVPGGPVKTLLLTHTGRKSGRQLHSVLQYFTLNGVNAVVASRGGTVDHPLWYLNLVANPDCDVRIGTFASRAKARTIDGEARAKWWDLITSEQPEQIKYQSRTSRIIPVVALDLV